MEKDTSKKQTELFQYSPEHSSQGNYPWDPKARPLNTMDKEASPKLKMVLQDTRGKQEFTGDFK